MADDALDHRKAPPQPALQRIHHVVHGADRKRRIDLAVKIDDLAVAGLAHAHVVDFADRGDFGGERRERLAHFGDARGRGVAAGQNVGGQRLDMGFDFDVGAELLAHRFFEPARHFVRGIERHGAFDFEIHRYRQPALDRLHGDVMNGQATIARDHHHPFAHRLVVERARLGGDSDLGTGQFGADGARQPVLDGGDAVERQRAAHPDREIDEQHRAGRPRPHPLDADDAGHLPRDCRDALADTFRRGVGQGIDGAPAKPVAGDTDEDRDHDRRRGIGPRIAQRDAAEPDQHRDRRPHVGAEMQRIGFERLAGCFPGDAAQRAGAEEIDHDGAGDDGEGRDGGFDGVRLRNDQPPRRLPDDDGREQKQQRRLGKRGDALDLAVTVLVLLVGRLAGEPHCEIGQHRRRKVDQRMAGLGQDRQRARQ